MLFARQWIVAVVAGLVGCTFAQPAQGSFAIVSQSLSLDAAARQASFSITFDSLPDFFATNDTGLALQSFQFEIEGGWDETGPGASDILTAVIRGDEIRFSNKIRIRDPMGDGGPEAGGWGPLRGEVDYFQMGNTLLFSAPWSMLGITDHTLKYRLYTLAEGELQDWREERLIPLPAGSLMGAIGLGGVALLNYLHRHRIRPWG